MISSSEMEELKSGLTSYVQSITQQDRRAGHNMYKCPLCGSGQAAGRHDGAFSITSDGKAWKCFSCNQGGDIFTLIGKYEGIDDFISQARRAAEVTGVNVNIEERQDAKRDFAEAEIKGRYKDYIERCKAAASKTDYFKRRFNGLADNAIQWFNLGYDESQGVIVMPYDTDGSYYLTRSIEGKTFRKPKSDDAGVEPIYNKAALYGGKPCFVTESPIDAISIMLAGGGKCGAISLGGTGHRKLIEAVEKQAPSSMIILSFDADDAGAKATALTAEELKRLNIPFIIANYSLAAYPEESRKDANDFLRGNLKQLTADIEANIEELERLANAEKAAALEVHNANNAKERLKDFISGIVRDSAITTGFSELDKELDGGLYSGLYILGAISSLGKTTLLLQLADQIAAAGYDILYFSLEMAANELISKTISRLTFQNCQGYINNAKTARGITTASRYRNYSKEEIDLINNAYNQYSQVEGNIYFYEGIGNIGIDQIKAEVATHKELTGVTPLVFIDYLQILAPYDMRASDKQNTDKAVLELKRLSRDYKTPVVAISSFNRDNYTSEVNMTAFKESGAIEYGSDVLLAIQPQGMKPGYTKTEQKANADLVKKCKASTERSVEVVILKNRNGKTGGKVGFDYYALFNCFKQDYGFTPVDYATEYEEDDLIPFGADF